jgi:2-polyprenyl-3-methyl-5-hydroxy-6-metoxy-1,4-benzoquinol methylase
MKSELIEMHAKVDQLKEWAQQYRAALNKAKEMAGGKDDAIVSLTWVEHLVEGQEVLLRIIQRLLPKVKVEKLVISEDADGKVTGATKYSEV